MGYESFLSVVGKNIKGFRQKRGWVQREMQKLGYSLRRYQEIESGKSNLTLKTLWHLAEGLGVRVADLVGEERSAEESARANHFQILYDESPIGMSIWEFKDPSYSGSLELVSFNRKAIQFIPQFGGNIGKKLLEIFPKSRELRLHDLHYQVCKTGKSERLPNLYYSDKNVPLGVYTVWSMKCGPNGVAILFDDITEEHLEFEKKRRLEQTQKGDGVTKPKTPLETSH